MRQIYILLTATWITLSLYADQDIQTIQVSSADEPEFVETTVESYYDYSLHDGKRQEQEFEQIDLRNLWKDEEKKPVEKRATQYRLRIGDQLYVSIYGFDEAESTSRLVTVEPTGALSYLFVDSVPVLGKTIDEVREILQEKIREQYPNVLIAVTATELLGEQFTIMGEVNIPGTKQLVGNMTVLKAIALAGGFPIRAIRAQAVDYADLDRAFVARKGEYIPISFKKLIRDGDLSQDIPLEGGDYIFIPSLLAKQIYVLGEVIAPSIYSYMETASLAEVIAWSGGFTERAIKCVAVIRGSLDCPEHYLVNFDAIQKGYTCDFLLRPGDIVYVPCDRWWRAKEVVKSAIRTFVGSLAINAGQELFFRLVPNARGVNDNSVIVNPGTTVQLGPRPVSN